MTADHPIPYDNRCFGWLYSGSRAVRMKSVSTICFLLLLTGELSACKYSVRDVAFVNLNRHSYHLYLVDDKKYSGQENSRVDQMNHGIFLHSNIEFHAKTRKEFENEITLDETEPVESPRYILIDQAGRHYTEQADPEDPLAENHLIRFLDSPARKKLSSRFLNVHSTILLLEGKEAKWNRLAKEIIQGSISEISETMDELPKKIPNPPEMVSLSAEECKKEKILLWSLGIDQPVSDEARIVILYGRGRKLGPVFEVPGLTQTELVQYLNYVGQDCECELDRSEMQGIMIPLKWDQKTRQEARELLGFNPDNEFIREEVTRILERGLKRSGKQLVDQKAFQSEPLLGYAELNLQSTGSQETLVDESPEEEKDSDQEVVVRAPSLENELPKASPKENTWVNSLFISLMIMLMVYLAARTTSPSNL